MPHAIVVHEAGGPDVMRWEEVALADPGPGEVRLKQTVVGLNFIDTYQRSGQYKLDLPATPGMEGVGVVDAVGEGVSVVKEGDRVGYCMGKPGSYAEYRLYPAERLIPLPEDISDEQAAAMLLKGLTAVYLTHRTYKVQQGDTVLFHAAAGGVGLIACQMLDIMGATVIGTVGSDEKAELAKAHGCKHPIVYTREDFLPRVKEITGGKGVPVVYDAVGKDTFEGSMDSLAPFGVFVSFGASSGPPPAVSGGMLSSKGSLYFTRPTLATHTATRELMIEIADIMFDFVRKGVKVEVNQTFPLKEAAKAHAALEGRKTTGSTLLTI